MPTQPEDRPSSAAITIVSEASGSAIGAALGLLVAGPVGAVGGAALGPLLSSALKKVVADIQKRLLAPREELRIATTLTYAVERIQERLSHGDSPRSDNFAEATDHERSAAEELAEGVLRAAQREYEERKVPFYGALLANIAFSPQVDRPYANFLLRTAERLSFRQLALLAFLSEYPKLGIAFERRPISSVNGVVAGVREDLLQEIEELSRLQLVSLRDVVHHVLFVPEEYNLMTTGRLLIKLMELERIDPVDFAEFIRLAQAKTTKYRGA